MNRPASRDSGLTLAVLAAAAAGLFLVHLLRPAPTGTRAVVIEAGGTAVMAVAAAVILRAARREGAWRATARYGVAVVALAIVQAAFLGMAIAAPPAAPYGRSGLIDLAVVGVGALLVPMFATELREHFAPEDRREVMADVLLLAVASGSIVYLTIRPGGNPPVGVELSCALWAGVVMSAVVAWWALALWLPSLVHVGLALAVATLGASGLAFAARWFRGTFLPGDPWIEVPLGLAALFLAGLLWAEPQLVPDTPARPTTKWGRAVLTAVAVGAACASLAFVAVSALFGEAGSVEATLVIAVLGTAIAARILFNQVASTRASDEVTRALQEKDRALRDADGALVQLREVHRAMSASEERLRLLLDAAADGIVELDGFRVIRRANEAFCSMLGLSQEEIVGTPWSKLAERAEGGVSLAELPETGRATLPRRGGQDLHVEARSSDLPGSGELLVVRDVTAARVADQTIRSLLQFLQDRDEDRTRLLQRTNAAIESERNRIARDLHDGPVQGVSAASLSLEAVLMMLQHGQVEKAANTLAKIREELAGENESLRRLMSDMRPPVLDERGLVPALREILTRFGRETGVRTRFGSRALVDVPADLETLAYRIVQEALTNAGKHARANEVQVNVEAVAGQLRIEVHDDGVGFDAGRVRDFLRAGRVGLASMRERTELANGSFMVRSAPGQGTTIVAMLPLDVTLPRSEPALA